jgi:ubiquitin carboxyl-terminal hydrolase 14
VKKSVFHAYKNKSGIPSIASTSAAASGDAASPETTTADLDAIEDDEDWYKFDDEKVSLFPKEKLATLDGGGEDSSAYVLLYRSKNVA